MQCTTKHDYRANGQDSQLLLEGEMVRFGLIDISCTAQYMQSALNYCSGAKWPTWPWYFMNGCILGCVQHLDLLDLDWSDKSDQLCKIRGQTGSCDVILVISKQGSERSYHVTQSDHGSCVIVGVIRSIHLVGPDCRMHHYSDRVWH